MNPCYGQPGGWAITSQVIAAVLACASSAEATDAQNLIRAPALRSLLLGVLFVLDVVVGLLVFVELIDIFIAGSIGDALLIRSDLFSIGIVGARSLVSACLFWPVVSRF